jgi:hypothetical protein
MSMRVCPMFPLMLSAAVLDDFTSVTTFKVGFKRACCTDSLWIWGDIRCSVTSPMSYKFAKSLRYFFLGCTPLKEDVLFATIWKRCFETPHVFMTTEALYCIRKLCNVNWCLGSMPIPAPIRDIDISGTVGSSENISEFHLFTL